MSNNKAVGLYEKFQSGLQVILNRCYYASVEKNLPRISAICLSLLTRRINRKRGVKRILCIGSLASLYDMDAMVTKSNRLQYLYLPRFYFGYILKKNIRHDDLKEANYHVDHRFSSGKEKTYKYLLLLFVLLRRIVRFDAVMTSNFGYVEQQEFMRVAKEQGVPVIVLYKEGLGNQLLLDNVVKSYKTRKSQCDLFLCYNENIKQSLLKYNIEGLDDNNICVTGIPRLDYYLDKEQSAKACNQITFFSYLADNKFSFFVNDEKTMELLREKTKIFHEFIVRYAVDHPDCKVVIKTKLSKHDISYALDIAYDYLEDRTLPDNLIITNQGNAMAYIQQSHYVFGGNSTVLLEALLAGKLVASIDFTELFDHSSWSLFEGYEPLLTYFSSYEQLVELLDSPKMYTEGDQKLLDAILKNFIHRADGMSAVRAEDEILQLF